MKLGQWMKMKGYKDRRVADDLGVGRSYVTRLRLGIELPSPKRVIQIETYTDGDVRFHDYDWGIK